MVLRSKPSGNFVLILGRRVWVVAMLTSYLGPGYRGDVLHCPSLLSKLSFPNFSGRGRGMWYVLIIGEARLKVLGALG